MLPRHKRGVVDEKLLMYGAKRLKSRGCEASSRVFRVPKPKLPFRPLLESAADWIDCMKDSA